MAVKICFCCSWDARFCVSTGLRHCYDIMLPMLGTTYYTLLYIIYVVSISPPSRCYTDARYPSLPLFSNTPAFFRHPYDNLSYPSLVHFFNKNIPRPANIQQSLIAPTCTCFFYKTGCIRQFESKLSLPSLALFFHEKATVCAHSSWFRSKIRHFSGTSNAKVLRGMSYGCNFASSKEIYREVQKERRQIRLIWER